MRIFNQIQVEEVSFKLGLNPNQVFPVRNYSIETECDLHIDILNLRAQIQILRNSRMYLKDKIKVNRSRMKTMSRQMKELGMDSASPNKDTNKTVKSKGVQHEIYVQWH